MPRATLLQKCTAINGSSSSDIAVGGTNLDSWCSLVLQNGQRPRNGEVYFLVKKNQFALSYYQTYLDINRPFFLLPKQRHWITVIQLAVLLPPAIRFTHFRWRMKFEQFVVTAFWNLLHAIDAASFSESLIRFAYADQSLSNAGRVVCCMTVLIISIASITATIPPIYRGEKAFIGYVQILLACGAALLDLPLLSIRSLYLSRLPPANGLFFLFLFKEFVGVISGVAALTCTGIEKLASSHKTPPQDEYEALIDCEEEMARDGLEDLDGEEEDDEDDIEDDDSLLDKIVEEDYV